QTMIFDYCSKYIIMPLDPMKYPLGKYAKPEEINRETLDQWISQIEDFPYKLATEVESLIDEQLDTPYRPGGWTVRQLVHHCADSHLNSFVRFKWALTEDRPTIKAYLQAEWALLPDVTEAPIHSSLLLLKGLHERWVILLLSLAASDLEKVFIHPQSGKEVSLKENIGLYAWHGRHHLAHITSLKKRNGW